MWPASDGRTTRAGPNSGTRRDERRVGPSTNPGEQVHRALVEINGTGEEHRALRLGVDPLRTGHGRPFEDAPQDGGRCQVRVEVILVRPGRAKVAEVDTVGDDPRHLCQVTAVPTENLIPTMYIGLVEDLASAC